MKRTGMVILFLTVFFNTAAFAVIDLSVTGGYSFAGNAEIVENEYNDVSGFNYGFLGHLNYHNELFLIGLGLYYQSGSFKYEVSGVDQDFKLKSSWGPDIIFMHYVGLSTRFYGRIGFSLADDLEYDYETEYKSKTRYFNSGWFALGAGIEITDQALLLLEYQRCSTSMNEDHQLVRHTVNAGLMFVL